MTQSEKQLKDFSSATLGLLWQRQATLSGATLLAAYYVNLELALICYGFCQLCEFLDCSVARRILAWDGEGDAEAQRFLNQLTLNAVLGSIGIVQYVVLVAMAEGPSMHMGPLFFLLAASLYVAMNNCQVPRVLIIRLAIFSAVFVLIPIFDLWIVRPPLDSELWKQLGIVLFVLYFMVECSRKFHQNYLSGLNQVQELCVERDRVTEAYKLQSQFVSVVSHELRTPLTLVKTSLDLLNCEEMGSLPEQLRPIAKSGQEGSNRLALLIDDLLDFQKLKSGKLDFKLTRVELGQFLRDAVQINEGLGHDRDISVGVNIPVIPVYVNADTDRLMQVMVNILSNAIKFSHDGGHVEVTLQSAGGKGRVSVRDNGIGIPENSKDIVFGPFRQVDCPDTRDHGGSGLGMSICKEILEGHGGNIDYFSTLGVGTTFVIELGLIADSGAIQDDARCHLADTETSFAAE